MSSLLLLLLTSCAIIAQAFVIVPGNYPHCSRRRRHVAQAAPRAQEHISTELESAYPPDTPAGLRGEAVRSALTSGRCIAWNLSDSPLQQGWVKVEGKGCMDFLNNKLSQTVDSTNGSFTRACLLSPKGKVVDTIGVAVQSPTCAFLLTSPGHSSANLFNRLDPLIFPMDQVKLTQYQPTIITLLSTKLQDTQQAIQRYILPLVNEESASLLQDDSCTFVSDDLTIIPHAILPTCAGYGYSCIFTNSQLATQVWQDVTGEDNPDGPIGIGSLEYATLRIQAGLPAFGYEYGDTDDKKAGPLELHLDSLLDFDKGCYLGQEGVASVVKNVRGPPRTLYAIVFDDESNDYDLGGDDDDNPTTLPKVGQEIYVLGSNEGIAVGTITSLAEPSGTGDATIVGLVLARRADSILKQMDKMDLQISREHSDEDGIIAPPPLDPLDGLEVIVGGTYTVGKLQMVPSRRFRLGQNMFFVQDLEISNDEGSVMGVLNQDAVAVEETKEEEEDLEQALEEAKKAQAEAEAAAAEAKRKEEKMELLKKRAEEAMARRRKKKT